MQSCCIYAEAFAGPFRPLRAPEPPFTHKTPPFTQVLFLFDAFYGTISLRKPSSLCSYKTESEAPMKKRILALLLAFSMGGGIGSAGYASNEPLPDLVMGNNGIPDTSNAASRTEDNKTIWYGTDWTYDGDTLTLKSGNYDFSYTYPKNSTGTRHSNHVKCNVVVNKGAAITGGILDGDSLTNSGTVKDILFAGYWLTNNNGTLSCLLGSSVYDDPSFTRHTMTAVDGSQIYYTVNQQSTGNGKQLYFTGTPKFTVMLEDSTIHHINGRIDYGGLKKEPDSNYYTFTPEKEEDIVLNDTIIHDPFTMTDGYPTASNGGKTACKGEGWEYILGNPEHGDFLFLSNAQIDFSKISDGSPVE